MQPRLSSFASLFLAEKSRVTARRLLAAYLTTDAAFDAFCLDYFPVVKQQLSDGMSRTRKVNLLLESCPPEEVIGAVEHSLKTPVAAALPLRSQTVSAKSRHILGLAVFLLALGAAGGLYSQLKTSRLKSRTAASRSEPIDMLRRGCYAKDHSACKRMLDRYQQDCRAGQYAACNDLGLLYEQGLGTVENPATAAIHYKTGCDGVWLSCCAAEFADWGGPGGDALAQRGQRQGDGLVIAVAQGQGA